MPAHSSWGVRLAILEYNASSAQIYAVRALSFTDSSATAPVLPAVAWGGRLRTPPLATHAAGASVWLAAEVMVAAGGAATVRLGNALLAVEP
jgi:hypothetical protein